MLAVDVVGVPVTYGHDFICMTVALSSIIYFEFYSEEPAAVSIEDWVGLVIVILYAVASFKSTVTIIAVGVIVTTVTIVGIVCMDYPAAIYTGVVVVVITILTERKT